MGSCDFVKLASRLNFPWRSISGRRNVRPPAEFSECDIDGVVDRPTEYKLVDLRLMPSVSRICWLECGGNRGLLERKVLEFHETAQLAHGSTGCTEWTGVLLSLLVQEAGLQKGAN